MKLNYSLCIFTLVSFIAVCCPRPSNYAYQIYYQPTNTCNQQQIIGMDVYPIYGNNGTCYQRQGGHYMKSVCSDTSATIYSSCTDSNCQNCASVSNMKFQKNECGIPLIGCSTSIPKLQKTLLYEGEFDAKGDCSGNLLTISGQDTNQCYPGRYLRMNLVTCNEKLWTIGTYYGNHVCDSSSFMYNDTGPVNVCVDNKMKTCGL